MKTLLNLVLLLVSFALSALCLWTASHASWPMVILAIWGFSLINNMPFSLMHEAVHGAASPNKTLNRLIGTVSGWAFPTSFLMQKTAHLGHHQRNRTDDELYDYYLPTQSKAIRNIWLYAGNLMGLYWWSVILGNICYLLAAGFFRSKVFVHKISPAMGFGPYVKDLVKLPIWQTWLELVFAFAWQGLLFYVLDLNLIAYLLCNVAFALHWSVLQYADHAWSSRDIRDGAWNLKVLPPFRWVALNYHYHLAHHQHPEVPWYDLPKFVDHDELQPSFWRVYFSLWKGVRPAPPMGAPADLDFLFPSTQKNPNN